jgi:uncharacterized membrane protein
MMPATPRAKGDRVKRFEERVTIVAPKEQVFDYVSDFSRHGDWAGHGLKVTADGSGPVAVGSTYSTEAKQFGTQREKSTVTELTPGQMFGWESKGALGTVHHWFSLAGEDGSTSLTKGFELVQPSGLGKFFGWRISRNAPKDLRRDLENIKANVESASSSPPATS